jgi:mannosyltransferase OCH1-like enzyme
MTASASSVPRILHMTCPSMSIPADLQANIDSLRSMNPGWLIKIHTDADIERYIHGIGNQHVQRAYQRLHPAYGAARADLFRYLVLFQEGGVYLDMKSTCEQPLDKLAGAEGGFLLAQWDNDAGERHEAWGYEDTPVDLAGGAFIQWFLLSRPGHPFLAAVLELVAGRIERYSPFRDGVGKQAVLKTTGPIAFTEAILPLLGHHPHRRHRKFTECGLVYSIFERANESTRHRGTFGTHYSQLALPLTRQGPGTRWAWQLLCGGRRWIGRLRDRVRRAADIKRRVT